MSALLTSIGYMLADFYVGGTLLLGAVLIVISRIKQPSQRLAVARITLMALALLAVLLAAPGWPKYSLFRLESREEYVTASKQSRDTAGSIPSAKYLNIRQETAPAHLPEMHRSSNTNGIDSSEPSLSDMIRAESDTTKTRGTWWWQPAPWPAILAAAQGLTALLVGIWLILGAMQAGRLCRRAIPAAALVHEALQQMAGRQERLPRVLLSPDVPSPMTLGVRRPTILLPANFTTAYNPQSLYSALAHEWAHIRHGDLRFLILIRGLLLLLVVHPFFHRFCRLIRDDQETLADAAAGADNRPQYAAELVKWARQAVGHSNTSLAAVLGILESPSQLSRRIVMLLDEGYQVETSCSRKWRYRCFAVAAGLILVISLATLRPLPSARAAASEQDAQPASAAEKQDEQKKPAETLTYTGQVIDKSSGKPIAGATVTVRREIVAPYEDRIIEEPKYTTDANGKYTFTIPPEQVAERFLYIELDITHPEFAAKKGFGYAMGMILKNEKLGERPFFEKVELYPGEPISGKVIMPDGKPASGMKVLGFSMPDEKDFESASFTETATDEQGAFKLTLAKKGNAVFWLLPQDYAPSTQVIDEKRGDLGEFKLENGTALSGSVVDEGEKPVPGVWINAEIVGGPAKQEIHIPVTDYLSRSALTDEKGEFKLRPLPAGECLIKVEEYPHDELLGRQPHRPLTEIFSRNKITLKQGEAIEPIKIRAMPQVVIEGQYYDSQGKTRMGHQPELWGFIDDKTLGEHDNFYATNGVVDKNGGFIIRAKRTH